MKRSLGLGTCPRCGKGFKKKGGNHNYCSLECSSPAHRTRFTIFNRDGFQCIYCGKTSFGGGVGLAVDHVRSIQKGGKPIASNLVTACSRCNCEKNRCLVFNEEEIFIEVARRNELLGIGSDREFFLDKRDRRQVDKFVARKNGEV